MIENEIFRVAAYQGYARVCPFDERLAELRLVATKAAAAGVDVLVFPECFLTGYFPDEPTALLSSIAADDQAFARLCETTTGLSVTVIAGFNERHGDRLYNAAAVIENGRCHGIYRKSYLYYGYHTAGCEYPVFDKKGVLFGVVICLDSSYLEPCRILARNGAKVIFCPMDNRVPPGHKYAQRSPYYSHIVARSFENSCWFVSADVTSPDDGNTVCPGHTLIYNNDGIEVARSREFTEELLIQDIPMASLARERPGRLFGNPEAVRAYSATERN